MSHLSYINFPAVHLFFYTHTDNFRVGTIYLLFAFHIIRTHFHIQLFDIFLRTDCCFDALYFLQGFHYLEPFTFLGRSIHCISLSAFDLLPGNRNLPSLRSLQFCLGSRQYFDLRIFRAQFAVGLW